MVYFMVRDIYTLRTGTLGSLSCRKQSPTWSDRSRLSKALAGDKSLITRIYILSLLLPSTRLPLLPSHFLLC